MRRARWKRKALCVRFCPKGTKSDGRESRESVPLSFDSLLPSALYPVLRRGRCLHRPLLPRIWRRVKKPWRSTQGPCHWPRVFRFATHYPVFQSACLPHSPYGGPSSARRMQRPRQSPRQRQRGLLLKAFHRPPQIRTHAPKLRRRSPQFVLCPAHPVGDLQISEAPIRSPPGCPNLLPWDKFGHRKHFFFSTVHGAFSF